MTVRLCALVAAGLSLLAIPRLAAQTPAPEAAAVLRGDVNGDGRVTREDAEALRAYLVRGAPPGRSILPAADANGDGRVTAVDAALISRFAAGVDVSRFPVGRPVQPSGDERSSGVVVSAEYECTVDLEAGTQNCREVTPGAEGGARLDLSLGIGPLTFNSSWVHSRGSTADPDTSTNTLSFTNNLAQPIGTSDGTTPDPDGNRLFFTTVPYVSSVYSGSPGTITLETPDGTADFFGHTSRPYFQYDGILAQTATSSAEPIRYIYPANTKSFRYSYRVSAPVQYESGWITVAPAVAPTLNPGGSTTLTGTVYDQYGAVQADGITWSSSNDAVAAVDASTGVVTGVSAGTVTITATSTVKAARTGTRSVTVSNTFVWDGSASSSWTDAANWAGGVVPGATSDVSIPAGTPNQPVLAANAEINDLEVHTGATLGLGGFTLEVNDDADASGTVSSGTLWLTGASALLNGNTDDLLISGDVSLQGATAAAGPVSVGGGGSLTMSSTNPLTVSNP